MTDATDVADGEPTQSVLFDGPPAICDELRALTPAVDPSIAPILCSVCDVVTVDRVRELRTVREERGWRVLVIAGEPPAPFVTRTLNATLDGVVLLDAVHTAYAPAITALAAGLRVMPNTLRERLQEPALSTREKQILAMLVLNASNSEIASKLFTSESNVKFHLTSAFAKLGVRSRSAAAAMLVDADAGLGLGILRITPQHEAE